MTLLLAATALSFVLAGGKKAKVEPPDNYISLAAQGDLAVAGHSRGAAILDIGDPYAPKQRGRIRLRAPVHSVAIEGDRAYLAGGSRGLFIVDLSDPTVPEILQRVDTDGKLRDVAVHGDYVYLADQLQGLRVVDLSATGSPLTLRRVSTRHEMRGLALHGTRLATAEGTAGVRIFDISRPGTPRPTASITGASGARGVALTEALLLVAAGRRGLLIYSLEDTSEPLAEVPALRLAESLGVDGSTVVVSNGKAGLQLIDIAEPAKPRQLSTFDLGRSVPAGRPAFRDALVLTAAGGSAIVTIDASDRAAPVLVYPARKKLKVSFPR